MAATTRASSSWSLCDLGASRGSKAAAGPRLLWPAPPRCGLSPLLSGLAPNRDHNGDLARELQAFPRHRAGAQPVFAVFAADPFINGRRIAAALIAKGYSCVVNWPTTGQFGHAFAVELDSVDLGPQQECDALRRLASQGLRVSAAVAGPEPLKGFLELAPQRLFVAPAFEHWCNGKLDGSRLLRSCAAIARGAAGRAPIVLMADRGTVTLTQARAAGAEALLTP